MPREVNDWLSGYLKYSEGSEPPRSYHTWCGLSLIAGALQRRVFLEWGFETIYPNIYVVLVGPSGKARKGIAIGIAKDMLSDVTGVTIAPNSTSREALVKKMKESGGNYNIPGTGQIKYHCSVTIFSEELSVFLGQKDTKFLANLTDWYDSKDRWEYETIGRGNEFINGVCCNFLGGTAPDWIQSMLPQEAIGGGFTARIIFVVEETKGKTVPKHTLSTSDLRLREALVNDLSRINNMAGPFSFDKDGERTYTQWYENYDKELASGKYPVNDPRFSSYCERRATHLRKVAMLMSASRGDSMQITSHDITRALEVMNKAEMKMHKTFGGLGRSKIAGITHDVLEFIQQLGSVPRSTLLVKFHNDVTVQDLKMIEDLMDQMKVVETTILSGGEKIYKWKGYRKNGDATLHDAAEQVTEPVVKIAASPKKAVGARRPLPH